MRSNARLDAVKGITAPEAKLKGTDSTDPNDLSWYTTPEGSRIAEISTQGDATGGAIVAWVIIGGADGFVVNPRQFYFQDGTFTDAGLVEPPNPANHRVATGQEYQFSIDYSTLSHDPNANKSAAGYLYAPGTPVAIWQNLPGRNPVSGPHARAAPPAALPAAWALRMARAMTVSIGLMPIGPGKTLASAT